jgi:hypothetical protein
MICILIKKRITALLVVLMGFCSLTGSASDVVNMCHYSTEGTEFWFGFLQNRLSGSIHYIEITVTSQLGANFTLTYGPDEKPIGNNPYTLGENSLMKITLDYTLLEPSLTETIENKGIHLVSDNPVNVYAFNYRTQSSDVAVIYPEKSIGSEYMAMCYSPHVNDTRETNSEFMIVATANNTNVKITPSANTDGGNKANTTFKITLNKGELYQVKSTSNDLTGSYVTADQPIAFFSGSISTTVPLSGSSYDHLYEQIPQTNTWGREFYAVPLNLRSKDTYRVLAAENGTIVTIGASGTKKTLSKGQYYEFELTSSQACKISSTKKILLAQYCRSQAVDGSSGVGDPFMTIISPITQKISDVTFTAYESNLIQNIFYVNVVTLTSEVALITLDGSSVGGQFTPFSGTEYSYAQLALSKGNHRLKTTSTSINGGFLAFIYGFGDNGNTESYGYGVGFSLNLQLDIQGEVESDTLLICEGDSTELDAGAYFNNYRWSTGDTVSSITVTKQGWYKITAKTNLGCIEKDSVYLKTDKPQIYLGKDTTICLPGEMTIKALDGYRSYLWQDNSTNQYYTVEKSGDYSVTVINQNQCKNSDTIHVEVIMPVLNFKPDSPVATLDHPDINFINLTNGAVDFEWNFGDGATSNETSPLHRYSDLGLYHVVLQAKSPYGCTDTLGIYVQIVPLAFSIPNAFRPTSEISVNRSFQPIVVGVDTQKYKFQIFNRIGAPVFQTSNYETGWNGNFQNGRPAEQGVYVWIIEYDDIQGYNHIQKGNVMLVR